MRPSSRGDRTPSFCPKFIVMTADEQAAKEKEASHSDMLRVPGSLQPP